MKKRNSGFTLAELLIVVAIIAVLVAIAIPIFTGQLEKSREATDLANIRAAYAEVMSEAIMDEMSDHTAEVSLKQTQDDWQTESAQKTLEGLVSDASHVVKVPKSNGTAKVEWKKGDGDSEPTLYITFDGEASGSGGSGGSSGTYNFGDTRKSRLSTLTDVYKDIYNDPDLPKDLVDRILKWNKLGTPTYDFKGETSELQYLEIDLNESGINKLYTNQNYYIDYKAYPFTVADVMKSKGADISDFKNSDYVGKNAVIYFDVNTYEPLAISYNPSGDSGTYRYVFLDDGATFDAENYIHRQYYVYHRDVAEKELTRVTDD